MERIIVLKEWLRNSLYEKFDLDLCIISSVKAYVLLILFGIYDDLTSDHVPGLQKYDICMTEQVSGP